MSMTRKCHKQIMQTKVTKKAISVIETIKYHTLPRTPHGKVILRPEFFYKLIYGNFFSDLGSGGRKIKNKKDLKMTNWSFSELFLF